MRRSFATFTRSIEQRIKDKSARPIIIPEFQTTGLRCWPLSSIGNNGYPGGDGPLEVVHRDKWMEAIDRFRGALQRVHDSLPETHGRPEKVKVALIDDGVRLDKLHIYFGQMVEASGLSYYPRGKHTEEPWHNSTHGRGTVMANMIARVNPWVSLCVMRVHDIPSRDGSRMITARSAAMAIRAAIGRKVNIISMSWSILAKHRENESTIPSGEDSGNSEQDPELEDLRAAIDEAVEAKILIFCSANDDISLKVTDFLPYQRAPKYIFRIGAADQHGKPDNVSEDFKAMNFYLPGNKVAETENPTATTPITYHTGSWVSTALAAGQASLIIYCATLGKVYYDSVGNKQRAEEFSRRRDALKERNYMETAFQSIKFPGWNSPKFPPVWGLFGDATASIIGTEEDRVRLEALTSLVHKLSSGIR
ncbi:uncharacterized protein N7458_011825 [Penicillium daleae]|uniref:Peptidase S8/S53 domain-containing protein n=1 Tax=Penicillium daleae TaxID=63821 RepID=A0AAD6BVV0_9EURO|nr:uncharacterized protein N7458_011825 [Penicillium daleae]KAJ5432669.1 hypothetical protein N7458_011825 [Penicillium daleae]